MTVVTNFYTQKKFDSIIPDQYVFYGTCDLCGKGPLNMNLFRERKIEGFYDLRDIKTAHHIVLSNRDSIYVNGKAHVACFKKGDSVQINASVYSFYQQGKRTNLLIVDDLTKL